MSKLTVNKTSSGYLLLKTYKDAKEFFKDKQDSLKKLNLRLQDIKAIYDIAKKYNKISPIVAHYKSKKVFVFRRWIDNYLNEWQSITHNSHITDSWFWTPVHGIYAGPHNTNLKESGVYTPSAEDMESIIAFAFNKITNQNYNDYDNIKYVCNI